MDFLTDEFGMNILTENRTSIYFDTHFPKTIFVKHKRIDMEEKILKCVVVRNTIVLLLDHCDLHLSTHSWDKTTPFDGENLYALDTDGNILWKSKDLIADSKAAFDILYPASEKDPEDNLVWGQLSPEIDYCVCANVYAQYYLIDLTNKRLLNKKTLKC